MKLGFFTLPAAVAGIFCMMPLGAQAQNLVANGGFETGDFTAWNTAISGPFTYVDEGTVLIPHGGAYYALFGDPAPDNINQVILATPGGYFYDINYWVNDMYGDSDITVNWGAATLSSLGGSFSSSPANNGWVDFNFLVPAPSAPTDLSFTISSQTLVGLDDVSITAVPDSSTAAGDLAGLVLAGAAIFLAPKLVPGHVK